MFKVFLSFLESIYRNPIAKFLFRKMVRKGKALRQNMHDHLNNKTEQKPKPQKRKAS